MNELKQLVPEADTTTLEKIISFGYAIQSSDETPITKILPDFPSDNLKLAAQISQANPSISPFQLLYRLYPYDSFLPKECHGSLTSLFDALEISTSQSEKKSYFQSLSQPKEQQILSVERPTLSKSLLESEFQHHEGEKINQF